MQIAHRSYRNVAVIDITGQFNFGTRKEFSAALEKASHGRKLIAVDPGTIGTGVVRTNCAYPPP